VKTVEAAIYKYREMTLQNHIDDVCSEYIAFKFRSYIKRGGFGKIYSKNNTNVLLPYLNTTVGAKRRDLYFIHFSKVFHTLFNICKE
jgi:hypothetical protein